ncbi:MAG: DUF1080 domain-containing protein [Planctomycetes bacterium]|nr:DUF1080 domain-containing protein [Planctomycetota bacterium]
MMKNWIAFLIVVIALCCGAVNNDGPVIKEWSKIVDEKPVYYMTIDGVMVHEKDPAKQPYPLVVRPGEKCGDAPSDAFVLFDGSEESFKNNWTDVRGKNTKWIIKDGVMQPTKHSGYIQSEKSFGSCQLHVEFRTPANIRGRGQGRGNSGVFLMGQYEVQILDSYQIDDKLNEQGKAIYDNPTYPDGLAGALYGRKKPEVNVCRKPGKWQSYDITFYRPIFKDGKIDKKAIFIVYQNGVLIQFEELIGGTGWRGPHSISNYRYHDDKLPIKFQDHGNPVCFRNVWIRPIKDNR